MKTVKFKKKKKSVKQILSDRVFQKHRKKKPSIADEAKKWEAVEKERERRRVLAEENKSFLKSLKK